MLQRGYDLLFKGPGWVGQAADFAQQRFRSRHKARSEPFRFGQISVVRASARRLTVAPCKAQLDPPCERPKYRVASATRRNGQAHQGLARR